MMKIPSYQVDAFTSQLFSGNPAAVCLLVKLGLSKMDLQRKCQAPFIDGPTGGAALIPN